MSTARSVIQFPLAFKTRNFWEHRQDPNLVVEKGFQNWSKPQIYWSRLCSTNPFLDAGKTDLRPFVGNDIDLVRVGMKKNQRTPLTLFTHFVLTSYSKKSAPGADLVFQHCHAVMFSDSLSRIPSLLILGVLPTSFHTMHPEQNLLAVKYNFQLS